MQRPSVVKPLMGFTGALMFSISVTAAPTIAPGQWLHRYEAKSQSGKLEMALTAAKIALKNLPPAQRAMVESMMEAQGISINFDKLTTSACVTPEQAKNPQPPKVDDQCQITVQEKLEDGFKVAYQCTGDNPVNGQGVWKVLDEKHYTIDISANVTYEGIQDTILIQQTGEWQTAACSTPQ